MVVGGDADPAGGGVPPVPGGGVGLAQVEGEGEVPPDEALVGLVVGGLHEAEEGPVAAAGLALPAPVGEDLPVALVDGRDDHGVGGGVVGQVVDGEVGCGGGGDHEGGGVEPDLGAGVNFVADIDGGGVVVTDLGIVRVAVVDNGCLVVAVDDRVDLGLG